MSERVLSATIPRALRAEVATFITLTRLDGAAIAVNADEILAVEPVPDSQLPAGIAAASYLVDVGSQYSAPAGLVVQGTPAAVAAALAAGGATFVPLTRADGAPIEVQGALVLSLEPVPTSDGSPSASTYLIDVGSQYAAPTLAVQGDVPTIAALLTVAPPALAGDVEGPFNANVVVGLQTRPISAAAPGDGFFLRWSAGAGMWIAAQIAPLLGDVTGLLTATVVEAMQGTPIDPTPPNTGEALIFDGTVWAPTALPGTELFRWNGLDLTQFGAFIGFKSDLGFDPVGVPTLAVVAAPAYYPGRNALRFTGTAFASGWWCKFLDALGAPLALPSAYEIRLQMVAGDDGGSNSMHCGVMCFGEDTAGTTRGLLYERYINNDTGTAQGVLNDRHSPLATTTLDNNGLMLNASNFNRGGMPVRIRVLQRQEGSTPSGWCVETDGVIAVAPFRGVMASADAGFDTSDWNGIDLPAAGLFIYNGGGVITGSFDVIDLAIVAL